MLFDPHGGFIQSKQEFGLYRVCTRSVCKACVCVCVGGGECIQTYKTVHCDSAPYKRSVSDNKMTFCFCWKLRGLNGIIVYHTYYYLHTSTY